MKGIYKFENKKNHEVYIGQSVDLDSRRNQHIAAKDSNKFHAALQKHGVENFTYTILEMSDSFTGEELDYLEAYYIDLYNSRNKGYNSTKGNHAERIGKIIDSHMHYVNAELSEEVLRFANVNNFGIDNHRENVLILGQGEYADYLKFGNNLTIISDSIGYKCAGAHVNIIRTNDITKDYMEIFDSMTNKHFDLIIANPPYKKIGAEITKYIIDNMDFDQYINLMPAKDYTRVKGLINHVDLTTFKKADNGFDDAVVDAWIANITKKHLPLTEEAFILKTYDERLMKCYEAFAEREHYAIDRFAYNANVKTGDNFPVQTSFLLTSRTVQDGVHHASYKKALAGEANDKTAMDVKWNVLGNVSMRDVHITKSNKGKDMYTVCWIEFNTAEEKENFANWWYNGKLSEMLIRGLNMTSGTPRPALPKVDWTRPWTDEEILADCGYTEKEIEEILK